MANSSDDLRDALVETLLNAIREQGTDTPSSLLNVARAYIKDFPPQEPIPLAGSASGILSEFLDQLPFAD